MKIKLHLAIISTVFFSSCQRIYFLEDPYWSYLNDQSSFSIISAGLLNGRLIRRRKMASWDELQLFLETKASSRDLSILTPFWNRQLEEFTPTNTRGKLVLLQDLSHNANVISVFSDKEAIFRQAGMILGEYIEQHPERKTVSAYFYRGQSYDIYHNAFESGFNSTNSSSGRLFSYRFFSAEQNDMLIHISQLKITDTIIVFALAHLNNLALNQLNGAKDLLFVTENNEFAQLLSSSMLFSIENDAHELLKAAFSLNSTSTKDLKVAAKFFIPNKNRLLGIKSISAEQLNAKSRAKNLLSPSESTETAAPSKTKPARPFAS